MITSKGSMFSILFLVLTHTAFQSTYAQDDVPDVPGMETDRPDATEASSVVPKGFLQVETGGLYESFKQNDIKFERTVYNTTLIRYGLLDNFEFRLGWNYEEQTISGVANSFNGLSPLLFGMKVSIAEEKNGMPEIALIGHLFLPFSASTDFKPNTTGADFRFSLSHSLSENTSIGYNIGAQWGNDSSEIAYIYTVAYGIGLTDKIGFYAELYGDLPENSSANHFWDAGFTYLLKPTIQFDATIGSGITKGQDILLSAGVSFRVPN